MVMLSLSLRAVFRKESWMFCAGLLLSIADLLKSFDLRHTNLRPRQSPQSAQTISMFLAGSPLPEHRGKPCFLAARFSQACAAQQVAASTIRRPPELFNPELANNTRNLRKPSFLTRVRVDAHIPFLPSRFVYNPRRGQF